MWELVVDAGPDAGLRHRLVIGRHHLGRSRACALSIADPAIEPHHAVVDVDRRGDVVVTQLAGRWPILLAGHPAPRGRLTPGMAIDIGDSRLVLRPSGGRERPIGGPGAVRLGVAIEGSIPDIELDDLGGRRRSDGCDSAVIASLFTPGVLVVRGDQAVAAARSILVQAAERAGCGVATMLSDRAEAALAARFVLPCTGREARTVVFVDRVSPLRSGPVAERLRAGAPGTVVLTLPADRVLPPETTALLQVGPRWRGSWCADLGATGAATSTRLHVAGCSAATAGELGVSRDSPRWRR